MKNNSYTLLQGSNSGITRLKLNDPGSYNSLSTDMLKSLINRFEELDKDQKTRVIIIEGSGKGFSAGHNLKEVKSLKGKTNYKKLFELCSELMMVIINCNKPVIAKVHGAAFAAGCQLVATCDLALSTDDAIFSTPGVNIGLFCSTPMVALSRNVGKKSAMEMLLTGDLINAKKAKEIGLINNCYNSSDLMEIVFEKAEKITSKSMKTIKIGKQAFYKQKEMSLEDAYIYTSSVMVENMLENDSEEGISAFLEKRKPKWDN